uniref:Uncharacterized protein n=1 Tax=Arundo donax TaxID=35708 RepID=A0A0A8ZCY2_ARUDO
MFPLEFPILIQLMLSACSYLISFPTSVYLSILRIHVDDISLQFRKKKTTICFS